MSAHRHDLATARQYLTEQQYANDANLAARQSIYAYQRPPTNIWTGALDLAALQGEESIVDVGCGNGRYLGALRGRGHRGLLCGADLSVGMLRSARPSAGDGPLLASDAQALPFADDSFDVTLAMHMLYHVPDRRVAIAELRRVLRPDGVALVVTNAESHLQELDDLMVDAAFAVTGIERMPVRSSELFKMEGGASELEASFSSVTAHHFLSELVIDDPAPVLAYVRSMSTFVADTAGELSAVLPEIQRRVAETIATEGAFRIRTAAGCFVCREGVSPARRGAFRPEPTSARRPPGRGRSRRVA